jgi:hypothetical protein
VEPDDLLYSHNVRLQKDEERSLQAILLARRTRTMQRCCSMRAAKDSQATSLGERI